ncbi:MAG: helix-turn-helix domain-containing protein [Lachnospiraceae bacterium]|nr:helix-turn-helix domain-containing protein [Lachnospiraceae bacterium]
MIGTRLKELRTQKGLTVAQLCSEMGLNTSSYVKYEREEREIGIDNLVKFSNFYGVTTDYLLGISAPETEPDPLEEIIAKYKLDDLEQELLRKYVSLPDKSREIMMNFLKETVAAKENKKNG